MAGRTIIVTGANTGLGKHTAAMLAAAGGDVIMGCRCVERADAAAADIRTQLPPGSGKLTTMKLDLSSMESVGTFVKQFNEKKLPLHVLVNNAGAMLPEHSFSKDGIESSFATNYLGHFLLTNLLLPTLATSAKESGKCSRIVNVASRLEKGGRLTEERHFRSLLSEEQQSEHDSLLGEMRVGVYAEDKAKILTDKDSYTLWGAYGTSKLAQVAIVIVPFIVASSHYYPPSPSPATPPLTIHSLYASSHQMLFTYELQRKLQTDDGSLLPPGQGSLIRTNAGRVIRTNAGRVIRMNAGRVIRMNAGRVQYTLHHTPYTHTHEYRSALYC
jgi:NAD(P)-dependent dehydrogenase (short-subunit alcohol dehydrogenase family)